MLLTLISAVRPRAIANFKESGDNLHRNRICEAPTGSVKLRVRCASLLTPPFVIGQIKREI